MQIGKANNIWIFEPNKYIVLSIDKVFDPLINLYYYNIFVDEGEEFKSPISSENFINKVKLFDRIIIKNIAKKGICFNKFIDIEFKIDNIGDRYISGYCNDIKQLIIIDKYNDIIVSIRPPYHIVVTNDNRIGSVFIEKPTDNN